MTHSHAEKIMMERGLKLSESMHISNLNWRTPVHGHRAPPKPSFCQSLFWRPNFLARAFFMRRASCLPCCTHSLSKKRPYEASLWIRYSSKRPCEWETTGSLGVGGYGSTFRRSTFFSHMYLPGISDYLWPESIRLHVRPRKRPCRHDRNFFCETPHEMARNRHFQSFLRASFFQFLSFLFHH